MIDKNKLFETIDDIQSVINGVNDEIWEYREVYFQEKKSAAALIKIMDKFGFKTESGIAGIPTAFVSRWGTKGPKIGILAEYDALDGLNQKGGVAKKMPAEGNAAGHAGHGCGHNSLGAGSLGAAIGLKKYCEENKIDAQISFFGCPAEENGSGKVFMARDGYFKDMDVCLTWHPGDLNKVVGESSLACLSVKYEFQGVASHAAAAPHLGRSALDGCEIMNVGVNYLREHIIPEARIHYSYLDAGSKAPNVVQDYACTFFFVRAPKVKQALEIQERVDEIAKGAAMISGTKVKITHMDGLADYIPNKALSQIMRESFVEVGLPTYTKEELALAKSYAETVDPKDISDKKKKLAAENNVDESEYENVVIDNLIAPYKHTPDIHSPGSTDVGDVSYSAPTAQFTGATVAIGTPGHSWQMTGQGNTSYAHKGVVNASKVIALTALKVIDNPDIIKKAKEEYNKACPEGYICPTARDFMPDIPQ